MVTLSSLTRMDVVYTIFSVTAAGLIKHFVCFFCYGIKNDLRLIML